MSKQWASNRRANRGAAIKPKVNHSPAGRGGHSLFEFRHMFGKLCPHFFGHRVPLALPYCDKSVL